MKKNIIEKYKLYEREDSIRKNLYISKNESLPKWYHLSYKEFKGHSKIRGICWYSGHSQVVKWNRSRHSLKRLASEGFVKTYSKGIVSIKISPKNIFVSLQTAANNWSTKWQTTLKKSTNKRFKGKLELYNSEAMEACQDLIKEVDLKTKESTIMYVIKGKKTSLGEELIRKSKVSGLVVRLEEKRAHNGVRGRKVRRV